MNYIKKKKKKKKKKMRIIILINNIFCFVNMESFRVVVDVRKINYFFGILIMNEFIDKQIKLFLKIS